MLVGPFDAPDVVADAVVAAFTNRAWPQVDNKRAYLYRAVTNAAQDLRRSNSRRRHRELRWQSAPGRHGLVAPPEPQPEVWTAVGSVTAPQRAAIFLTYWEDLDPAAIGRRLGTSEGTVRRQLARARSKLRGVLSRD